MIQIAKINFPQFAYIKLDGYTGATNFYLSITNEITNYKVSFVTSAQQLTNGRYTKCPIPMPTWYNDVNLHEGMYILEVKDESGNVFAKRLAFLRDNPSFKESTYEGYEGTDAEIYNVYEQ